MRGPDSRSMLSLLMGQESSTPYRESLIMQSSRGVQALRVGNWKYIPSLGSGGFTPPAEKEPLEGGPKGQLYDLEKDPEERVNLYRDYPEKVQEFHYLLDSLTTTL